MKRIERADLAGRIATNDGLIVVEALPESSYRLAHLPGAINIPRSRVDELAQILLPDKLVDVVVYCTNPACGNAEYVARRLEELGYPNVFVYAVGKQDWFSARLPVEASRTSRIASALIEKPEHAVTVACNLDEMALAERSEALRNELFSGAIEQRPIEGGYAFRFPGDGDWHTRVLEFVASERRCCSFFRIDVAFEPELGPIWLSMTGPLGTMTFIEDIFGQPAAGC